MPCSTAAYRPPIPGSRAKPLSSKSSRKAERVVRHVLADGSERTYRYAAYRPNRSKAAGVTVGDLIAAWQRSPEWRALAERTKDYYSEYVRPLMGMQHVEASRIERRQLLDIRNALATARGNGASNAFIRTASAVFGWGVENDWLKASPVARVRRLKGGHLPAWTQAEADLALRSLLREDLQRVVLLALYTGQRRGDLIALPWSAYDGDVIRLRQQKTKTPLVIPIHPILKAQLDTWRASATSTMILTNALGLPWKGDSLSEILRVALSKIEGFPVGKNLHGLRKLAAVRLAECGCNLHEIGAITGHRSLAMIQLYTQGVDQERLANAAVLRWTGGKRNL
jgi:integrase